MPIVNKGIFDLDIAFQRQVGNDWPIAEVVLGTGGLGANLSANTTDDLTEGTTNLYYTNARVLAHLAESNVSAKSFTTTGVGTPSLTSETSLILSANGTNGGAVVIQSSPIRIKSYTTVDRGNITAANGDLIFNSTDQILQVYSSNSWLSVGSIDLSGNTTTDLAEGDNLYYTNSRVLTYLSENDVSVQSLTVQGDLTVQGNTTTLNTATLIVEDKNIVLANGAADANAADGAGITIDGAQANVIYDSGNDRFDINKGIKISQSVGGYITFGADSYIGDEPGAGIPLFRIVAPAGFGATIETDTDISGNNWAWQFGQDGILELPSGAQLGDIFGDGDIAVGLRAPNGTGSYALISSKNGQQTIEVNDTNIRIITDDSAQGGTLTKEFTFARDGKFTAPGEIYGRYFTLYGGQSLGASIGELGYAGNIVSLNGTYGVRIVAGGTEGSPYWDFDTNGVLTTPGNVIANVIGTVSSIGNHTTTDLSEGDNLYYTNDRVDSRITETSIDSLSDVDITGINVNGIIRWDGNAFVASEISDFVSLANVANVVTTLSNFTTTDLAEGDNLYYTNARVFSNVSNMSINVFADVYIENPQIDDILIWDGNGFVLTAIEQATASNIANVVLSLQLNDTDDLAEGSNNLYFTSQRVVNSLQAGRGITISESGLISSIDDSADFNLLTDGGVGYIVTDTLANALVLPSPANQDDRFILRSIQVTNISDDIAYLNSNVRLNDSETYLAYKIPVPLGGSIEMLKRAQAFNRNDSIMMQGLDSSQIPSSNLLAVTFAYETVPSAPGLFSTGTLVATGNTDILIANTGSTYAIIESIKIINSGENQSTARIIWTDANNVVQSYFSYNLALPTNTSIEVLTGSKRINRSDKLYVRTNNDNPISVIVSGRLGDVTTLVSYSSSIPSGSSSTIFYDTELEDGTIIYYSIE